MALGKGEPFIAIINIRCANALLPPNDPTNPKDKSGYRLNLDQYMPKYTDKEQHNINYMDESRHKDQLAFQCVATIFPKVAEAVSRYAHEKKSEWGDG